MRTLEAVLVVTLAAACFSFLVPARRRARWVRLLPACAIVVAIVQTSVEGFRWQIAPALFLSAALLACTFPRTLRALRSRPDGPPRERSWPRLVGAGLSMPLLLVSAALPILFPYLVLPEPTGPNAVGLLDLVLEDTRRPETFTPDPHDHRELSVRLWYPAHAPTQGRPVSYGEHAREIGRILTRGTPFPPFLFDDRALIDTHSFRGAALAEGPRHFPVVIFSHAYWAGVSQSSILMEELASHGYVAVSVAHAHETPYSIDRESRIRAHDPRNPEFRLRGQERARALELEREIVATRDPTQIEALLERLALARPKMLESLDIWAADVSFVIDELERMNAGGFFTNRLDTDRVGVLGHSFGGTAAGEVCLTDPRCRAGCNLDGLQIGGMLKTNLTRPFLFVHHDNPTASNKTPNRLFFERSRSAAYLLLVRGTRHLDFSDLALYGRGSLLRWTGTLGDLDGRRCLQIQSEYLRAFFDKHLRGEDSGLLDGPSATFPEVEILTRAGA